MATVPKRSDQRRRRNKVDITKAFVDDDVEVPEPEEFWHPIAIRWYLSLSKSGQRIFYESSDWMQAFYVAEAMSRSLQASRLSGQLFAAVISATHDLLVTEADRRRMRIELERARDEGDTTVSTAMDEYRSMAKAKAA